MTLPPSPPTRHPALVIPKQIFKLGATRPASHLFPSPTCGRRVAVAPVVKSEAANGKRRRVDGSGWASWWKSRKKGDGHPMSTHANRHPARDVRRRGWLARTIFAERRISLPTVTQDPRGPIQFVRSHLSGVTTFDVDTLGSKFCRPGWRFISPPWSADNCSRQAVCSEAKRVQKSPKKRRKKPKKYASAVCRG